jgi:hypothetical protein
MLTFGIDDQVIIKIFDVLGRAGTRLWKIIDAATR